MKCTHAEQLEALYHLLQWHAQETGSNNEVQLTSDIDGIQVLHHGDNGGIVGILRLRSDGNLHSPHCSITSSANNYVIENRKFTRLDPITGILHCDGNTRSE